MSLFIHIGASGAIVPAPACIIETETTHTLTTSTTTSAIIVASEMGPNLPQLPIPAGDVGLTVGSLEEPVTSVHVPSYKSSKSHSRESSKPVGYANCFGLPYQDHNYGAPPPPTPPQSPKPNDPTLDDDTSFSNISTTSTTNEEELPHQGESITRCICGFNHDDEYMICCDKCLAWQHVDCMGLDRNNMPDVYMCERCAPRKVDKQKAKSLQTRKREKMTADSSSDDTAEDDGLKLGGQHRGGRRGVRTKKGHVDKTGHHEGFRSSKKFRTIKKDKDIKKGKPRRRTKSRSDASNTVDEEAQDAWVYSFSESGDKYEEASCNQYTTEIQMLLASLKINGQHDEHVKKISEILDVRLCRMGPVSGGFKGLLTLQDVGGHQPITEYRGKVLLVSQFRQQNPVFNKRCYPYVLFYKIYPTGEEVCIDAREFGNEARFVRRSCTPNALIRHIIQNGSLRIFLFSCCEIKRGQEVTIPFDFNYKDCISEVDCACIGSDCRIASLHHKLSQKEVQLNEPQPRRRRASKKSSLEDDSSQSSITNVPIRPVTPTTPNKALPSIQAKSESISKDEGCEISSIAQSELASESQEDHNHRLQTHSNQDEHHGRETEKQAAERRKKMTREERKIDAYMRAFERMEKMAKRRQAMANHRAQQKQSNDSEKTPECRIKEEEDVTSQIITNSIPSENNVISLTNNQEHVAPPATTPSTETAPNVTIKEETKLVVRHKKGKRRRGSGTIARRRNRTSSGGSDLLSPDENPLILLRNTAAAVAMTQSISSGGSVSGSSPGTPVPNHPLNGTNISMIANSLCSNIQEPSVTPPPIPTAPVTASPECIIPKSKRYLMRGWLQEKAESSSPLPAPLPVSCPLSVRTEGWASTPPKQPLPCYIRCTKDITPHGGISASHLRRNSASGGRPTTSLGSAKKRWLRQAMVESTDGNENPGTPLTQEDLENGHCSPMHNGCLSPGPNCQDVGSPSSVSPPGDYVTPLKKRRLMRESLDSVSPGMLSPGCTTMDRPPSASSSSASPEHQPNNSYLHPGALDETFNPSLAPSGTKMVLSCEKTELNGLQPPQFLPNDDNFKTAPSLPSCVKLVPTANNLDPIEVSNEGLQPLETVCETITSNDSSVKIPNDTCYAGDLKHFGSETTIKSVENCSVDAFEQKQHLNNEICKVETPEQCKESSVCDNNNIVEKQIVFENTVPMDSSNNRTKETSEFSQETFVEKNISVNSLNLVSPALSYVHKEEILSLQERRPDLEELLPIASALLEIQTVAETVIVSEDSKYNSLLDYGAGDITCNSLISCSSNVEVSSENVSTKSSCQNIREIPQEDDIIMDDKHIFIANPEMIHSEEISVQVEIDSVSQQHWNQQPSSLTSPSIPLSSLLPSQQISPTTITLEVQTVPDSDPEIPLANHSTPPLDSNSPVKVGLSVGDNLEPETTPPLIEHSPAQRLGLKPGLILNLASPLKNVCHNVVAGEDTPSSTSMDVTFADSSPVKKDLMSPISYKRPLSPPTTPQSNENGINSSAPKRKVSLSEYRLRMKENVSKSGGNNNSITDNGDTSKASPIKDKLLCSSFSLPLVFSDGPAPIIKRPTSLSLGHSSVHNNIGNIKKMKEVENSKHLFGRSEKLKREIRFDDHDKLQSASTNHKINHSSTVSLHHSHKSPKAGKSPPSSSKLYITQGSSSHQKQFPPPPPPPPPPKPPVGLPIPVLCSSLMVAPTTAITTPPPPPPIPPHSILSHHSSMILAVPQQVTSLSPSLRIAPGSIASNPMTSPSKVSGKNLVQQIPKPIKQLGNHFIHLGQPPPPPPPRTHSLTLPSLVTSASLKPVTQPGIVAINSTVPPAVGAMVHKLATLPPPPPPPPPKNSVVISSLSMINYKENRPQSKT